MEGDENMLAGELVHAAFLARGPGVPKLKSRECDALEPFEAPAGVACDDDACGPCTPGKGFTSDNPSGLSGEKNEAEMPGAFSATGARPAAFFSPG